MSFASSPKCVQSQIFFNYNKSFSFLIIVGLGFLVLTHKLIEIKYSYFIYIIFFKKRKFRHTRHLEVLKSNKN